MFNGLEESCLFNSQEVARFIQGALCDQGFEHNLNWKLIYLKSGQIVP